jgi:spore germination cell wall hydrolase CwlJ-like protein
VLNRVRSIFAHLHQVAWSQAAWRRDAIHLVGVELGLLAALTASLAMAAAPQGRGEDIARMTRGEMSAEAFARLTAGMDPAMLALASRMTPQFGPQTQDAAVTATPASLDTTGLQSAVLRLQDMTPDEARAWNASNPTSTLPNPPAKPFRLKTGGMLDEARAVDCMTAAIYYEARWESLDGQRAVAQVVLNRMRHPAYPKTVCGVVFQGSNLTTGCQFSFSCDGSMRGQPNPEVWARCRTVAEAALDGYVMKAVGNATHYHANYVAPYWSPNLVKVSTIGAHIFYRWTGGWGQPPAFSGRYEGTELAGMQLASLDKVAPTSKLDVTGQVKVAAADIAPTIEAADKAGKPADAHAVDPAAAPIVVTSAVVAKSAEGMTKAEDLGWNAKPRQQAQRLPF